MLMDGEIKEKNKDKKKSKGNEKEGRKREKSSLEMISNNSEDRKEKRTNEFNDQLPFDNGLI